VLREAKVKISSIASEIGTALQSATSTKRANSAANGPAIPSENAIRRSEQLINTASLATPKVPANSAEAGGPVAPIVNGFRFLPQELKFSVDKETGRQIIQVVDVESGKMIRQIPAEEVLNFIRQLEQRKGAVLSIKT
jgi:flagellar protein FlaG